MSLLPTNQEVEQYLFRRGGKYPVIGAIISVVHIIFLFFFHRIGILPMVIYNLISICGYLFFSAEAYKGNRIIEFFIYSILEIPLHAILATMYVGWNYRFMLILLGTIPFVYYFVIFINQFKRTIITPTIISIIYCFLYVGVRIYCSYYDPLITKIRGNAGLEQFYIYFNTLLTFISLITFNIFIAVEYNYINKKLLSENSQLDVYATFDPLTDLLNRRSTDTQLKFLFDNHYHEEDSFSIIMCDIDKFKSVNDTYGHDAGDYVLKEVAWILKDTVRDGDIVGRWGGEEFLILLNGNKASATVLAERIRSTVEAHTYNYKNHSLKVTITLGVSSYRANTDIDSLIKSADQKLYRGKENGRNQVVS